MQNQAHADRRRTPPGQSKLLVRTAMVGAVSFLVITSMLLAGMVTLPFLLLLAATIAQVALLARKAVVAYIGRHIPIQTAVSMVWAATIAAAVIGVSEGSADNEIKIALTAAVLSIISSLAHLARFRLTHGIGIANARKGGVPRIVDQSQPGPLSSLVVGATGLSVWLAATLTDIEAVWAASTLLLAIGASTVVSLSLLATLSSRSDKLRSVIRQWTNENQPRAVIHFSGSIRSAYQLDQWIQLLERAVPGIVLVVRDAGAFTQLARRYPQPILYVQRFVDLDFVLSESTTYAFYVNTAAPNSHLLRFDRLIHIQLGHGESDKQPSGSKTQRPYDYHFIAGEVAVQRLLNLGVTRERIVEIGRPVGPGATSESDSVLYAPTWEGAHEDSNASSFAVLGTKALELLLASTEASIRFRPHPLTGTTDPRLKRELADARRIAQQDLRVEIVDTEAETLHESFDQAAVLVTDISSVLVDFYLWDRPILVIDTRTSRSEPLHDVYPTSRGTTVVAPTAEGFAVLGKMTGGFDPARESRAAMTKQLISGVTTAETIVTALARIDEAEARQVDSSRE